ncbi:uncharacterized protein [Henckelia pumila]|uniref:uncharacterized protein n=1 Tax=Henckelia pumila TaxID=405737 RepID=UPI003C6E0EE1
MWNLYSSGTCNCMCPTLQEGYAEQVNAAGGFPGPPQQKYDPYSNTYNPGWRDHPNLRYGNPQANPPGPQAPEHNQSYRPPYPPPHSALRFLRQDTRTSIQNLNTQMGQLAAAISKLEAQNFSRLPSQIVVNPKENVSAITLRSGKELQIQDGLVKEPAEIEGDKEAKVEENEPIPKEAPRGDDQLDTAMLDLGASINVMPCSVYASLNLGPLNETDIVIQMADRSTIFPRGLLEDVLVQVGELVFPADFYILDMNKNELNSPILLGRPFLKTSKSVIDVDNGTLTMEFDGKIAKFNIFDALKNSVCESVVNILATPAEISTAENFISDMQAPKTATKHPPDRAKRISKKSKQKKHGTLTGKIMKWVKVDKGTRFKPP